MKQEMQMVSERKKQDEDYLFAFQKFLDTAENIKDDEFKNRIIVQMLKCDEILTKLADKMLAEEKAKKV